MMHHTAVPLLKTKLEIPVLRSGLVSRHRLTEKLDTCLSEHCRLILVSAPAGYGKTTLVSEWIATRKPAAAWISLDTTDSDPVRFWKYVIAALQTVHPHLGQSVFNALKTLQTAQLQPILGQLLNDLNQLDTDLLLVLDDYHQIDAPTVHDTLTFFLNHSPRRLKFLIITRTDPPLPVARLRARGQLCEIRIGDLKFSEPEVEHLLAAVLDAPLSKTDITLLSDRTEGWAAGLQLAALSLRSEADATGFINSFAGDNRYILDYLVEEVLSRQCTAVRRFLIQTSILPMMSGPLCDAVTDAAEPGSSREKLAQLEASNLFVIPMDSSREWYRYHHLFAELLRFQLQRNPSPGTPAPAILHLRAADWFAANGFPSQAVTQYFSAGERSRALDMIESLAWDMIQNGEHTTVVHWLKNLADDDIFARPYLSLMYAWALTFMGNFTDYSRYLNAARRAWEPTGDPRLGEAYNLEADMALALGKVDKGEQLARQALTHLEPGDDFNRGLSHLYLGVARFFAADLNSAVNYLDTAMDLCERSGNMYGYASAANNMVQAYSANGELNRAETLCRNLMSSLSDTAMYGVIVNHILLSYILIERNQLHEAQRHLNIAMNGIEENTYLMYFIGAFLIMSWLEQLLGHPEAAMELAKRAERNAINMKSAMHTRLALCSQVRLLLVAGDLAGAERILESLEPPETPIGDPSHGYSTILKVKLALESGKTDGLLEILDKMEDLIRSRSGMSRNLTLMILRARVLYRMNRSAEAMDLLAQTVRQAEPNGFIRVFAEEGPDIATLLKHLRLPGRYNAYIRQILDAFQTPRSTGPPAERAGHPDLAEPLTLRELDVLKLIASGLSNRAIGQKLFISPNTVKVHLKNLYAKLDVSSRTQAVARAGELNLI